MEFLHWYDWLTPSNPYASIFFGLVSTTMVSVTVWVDTNKLSAASIAAATGLFVTISGVWLLSILGYY